MFVDEVQIEARAGHGGRGCVAFLRETSRPKGGPSGGNGGRGGNVILVADHDINNLVAQYYQPRLFAASGQGGLGKGMDGKAGTDLVVKVPCGTLVWRLAASLGGSPPAANDDEDPTPSAAQPNPTETPPLPLPTSDLGRPVLRYAGGPRAVEVDFAEEPALAPLSSHATRAGELIVDLTTHGQEFVLCRGGRGGLGNRNFATSRRQAPRFAQPGEPGQEGIFRFELRLLADIGLVGYPNAGKSTLLSAISKARPRIAPYPFTTLRPQVGTLEYPNWRRLLVCDVPGLIEGAHRNVGLGHAFLRHIQRCQILVLVLDMAGSDGRKPWDDYRRLLEELELYDPALVRRPRLVVANKMDEAAAIPLLAAFKRRVPRTPLLKLAAAFDEGIPEFKQALLEAVEAATPSTATLPT